MTRMHTYRTDDGFNNPEWPSGASGDITSWQYQEGTGLLLKKEDALTQGTDYTYTTAGRLYTRTWARDNKTIMTTYTYNPAGDLTHIEYSDTTPDITFVYNRLGKKQSVIDGFGSRTFTYDPDTLNLVTETLSGLYNDVIQQHYETTGVTGRPTGITLSPDYEVAYGYDPYGRMNSVNWQAEGKTGITIYSYVPDSNLPAGYTTPDGRNGIRLRFKAIRLRNYSVSGPIGHIAKICVFFFFSFDGCHFG